MVLLKALRNLCHIAADPTPVFMNLSLAALFATLLVYSLLVQRHEDALCAETFLLLDSQWMCAAGRRLLVTISCRRSFFSRFGYTALSRAAEHTGDSTE